MAHDNEITQRIIVLLCSECNNPLKVVIQEEESWRNVVRIEPCPECLLSAYSKGHDAAEEGEE
jgi:type II secretory ATPase GspE/PulE/Tfp pilus assembly ATPase PilB-like protein